MVLAALMIAAAIIATPFIWSKIMSDQATTDVVAQLVAAQAAYDTKIAAAAAVAVAPVQAALDVANADLATVNATIADNLAAVKAQADAMTADSAPVA
jgi:sirohydrochlorin ferrochelatase